MSAELCQLSYGALAAHHPKTVVACLKVLLSVAPTGIEPAYPGLKARVPGHHSTAPSMRTQASPRPLDESTIGAPQNVHARRDSNPRTPALETGALPLSYGRISRFTARAPGCTAERGRSHAVFVKRSRGHEPRCENCYGSVCFKHLSTWQRGYRLVGPMGLEPTTYGLTCHFGFRRRYE